MADENISGIPDVTIKVRDLEERQRLMRDKVSLIGKNFIELKEEIEKEANNIKVDVSQLKSEINKLKSLITRVTEELENKAKRSELELIAKQLKMFQPLINQ